MSHLLQMRGLKHNRTVSYITYLRSHLLQMRGLKPKRVDRLQHPHVVASFTDAWIETLVRPNAEYLAMSHLLQMRGLKLIADRLKRHLYRRIFYRCVD